MMTQWSERLCDVVDVPFLQRHIQFVQGQSHKVIATAFRPRGAFYVGGAHRNLQKLGSSFVHEYLVVELHLQQHALVNVH